MPAAERRLAIMSVTERLLVERGSDVSTREIAEAAGIAEGTIYRVFATKDAIIDAIFIDAFDTDSDWVKLAAVRCDDLETCLVELVALLKKRIERILALFGAVGFRQPAGAPPIQEQRQRGYAAIADLLRPHADKLRTSPEDTARLLHGLVLSMVHPMLTDRPMDDPREIVNLALRGIGRGQAEAGLREC